MAIRFIIPDISYASRLLAKSILFAKKRMGTLCNAGISSKSSSSFVAKVSLNLSVESMTKMSAEAFLAYSCQRSRYSFYPDISNIVKFIFPYLNYSMLYPTVGATSWMSSCFFPICLIIVVLPLLSRPTIMILTFCLGEKKSIIF